MSVLKSERSKRVFGVLGFGPSILLCNSALLAGENKYYIFAKGSYKVGRKGCDIIITKDKGVSRIHAEIFVDAMAFTDCLKTRSSSLSSKVRIRDCSKYGTFINRNLGSMEKVHELPNKETSLMDGNLISFGTGNATYKFSFVPLVFWVYSLDTNQVNHPLQDNLSSIGARITYNFSQECTHVLVDELMPVKEDLLNAIVAKKACILSSWAELVAQENICTEFPSCNSSHTPTFTVDGVSVKLADPSTRENCLEGYTFLLDSIDTYKFKNQLQSLLELSGAKVFSIESFNSCSQGTDSEANNYVVCVIPGGSATKSGCFNKLNSVSKVKETDIICAALTGKLDRSILISPCVVVSSSCSTDETIVADSEAEDETATSARAAATAVAHFVEVTETVNKVEGPDDHAATEYIERFQPSGSEISVKGDGVAESESGNLDVIYSQYLIVRDVSQSTVACTANHEVLNFKRFRKRDIKSGNSFDNLIPFSKYPYKESDHGNEEVAKSLKEEKRRKQMEAIAEDLFNNEKGRRRGAAGSLHGLLTKG